MRILKKVPDTIFPKPGVQRNSHRQKLLLTGIVFGVLACFLAAVGCQCIASKWGPWTKNIMMDRYSGHSIVYTNRAGKQSSAPSPFAPSMQWAKDHQDPERTWYVYGAGMQRTEWFGQELAVDCFLRDYVYEIYKLSVPEQEKVELLLEYHRDLDALKLKEQEKKISDDDWKSFYEKWDQKLKILKDGPLEK
jgi:hypothetical protein